MTTITSPTAVEFAVTEQPNIDTICYRGVASLASLASISQADVFDQVTHPDGLQRDLSPKHASEAHQYATREKNEYPRAFPEVILNVRDKSVLTQEALNTGRQRKLVGYTFKFDLAKIDRLVKQGKIAVSRVDGNHRLFYALGDARRKVATAIVPFQIHVGLSADQEANLFVDVNANQKGLNSSHLHILRSRLTPEEQELSLYPERVLARWLSTDKDSPWCGLVYLGGSRKGSREAGAARPVSFVTLEHGVKRTLTKSQYIHDLTSPDAQYILIRNFWSAVNVVFRDEWTSHKDFLILKNIGTLSFSILGGTVIDRCMARGEVGVEDMVRYVEQVRDVFNWSKDATGDGSVTGMSGNRAALIISGELTNALVDPGGETPAMQSLQARLLGEPEPEVETETEGETENAETAESVESETVAA